MFRMLFGLILLSSLGGCAGLSTQPLSAQQQAFVDQLQSGDIVSYPQPRKEFEILNYFLGGTIHSSGVVIESQGKKRLFTQIRGEIIWFDFADYFGYHEVEDLTVLRPNFAVDAQRLKRSAENLSAGFRAYDTAFVERGTDGFYYCNELLNLTYTMAGYPRPFTPLYLKPEHERLVHHFGYRLDDAFYFGGSKHSRNFDMIVKALTPEPQPDVGIFFENMVPISHRGYLPKEDYLPSLVAFSRTFEAAIEDEMRHYERVKQRLGDPNYSIEDYQRRVVEELIPQFFNPMPNQPQLTAQTTHNNERL